MIILEIKERQIEARKNRDADTAATLTTLLGEASTAAKNKGFTVLENDQAVALIKKFIKNSEDLLSAAIDINDEALANKTKAEIELLKSFLPKQLSAEELKHEIEKSVMTGVHSVGGVMQHLKSNFAGLYDGKLASQLIKEELEKHGHA